MNEQQTKNPFDLLVDHIRAVVREELAAAHGNGHADLLTAEQLAERLGVPQSWVYEQSRLGNIPTHRFGKYIRFDLREVIESQKQNNRAP